VIPDVGLGVRLVQATFNLGARLRGAPNVGHHHDEAEEEQVPFRLAGASGMGHQIVVTQAKRRWLDEHVLFLIFGVDLIAKGSRR
jgi:hypothetical protein